MALRSKLKSIYPEIIFQAILLVVVFIFYSHDRRHPQIQPFQYAFFLNYVLAAFVINYWLLPRFLYRKRYVGFGAYVVLVIALVIAIEEGLLEQIFFPDTRGTGFPGVFNNLLSAMPTITILAGFKFAWDALHKQRELEALQSAVKESELLYLKSQINPHFLFNNLNNLYAYAIENSPKTPQLILDLSAVLRYMLYDCQAQYVPLSKELQQLDNFIKISAIQIENRGEVRFDIGKINHQVDIAPLILPVFVENAFKHSASSQVSGIQIRVAVSLSEKGTLLFECTNSFMPDTNTENLSKGIGLENVRKRLSLLYPDAHKLSITTQEDMYNVTLLMNLQKASEP